MARLETGKLTGAASVSVTPVMENRLEPGLNNYSQAFRLFQYDDGLAAHQVRSRLSVASNIFRSSGLRLYLAIRANGQTFAICVASLLIHTVGGIDLSWLSSCGV